MNAARIHPCRSTNRPRRVTVQFVDSPVVLRADAFLIKGSDRRGLEQTEETMKLISNYELQKQSDSELAALFTAVSQGLVQTGRGSHERRNALASLENISRARALRTAKPRGLRQ
jgi:hypothetical protein